LPPKKEEQKLSLGDDRETEREGRVNDDGEEEAEKERRRRRRRA
jgi:hypothetical protein